jgi:hypothetical protein
MNNVGQVTFLLSFIINCSLSIINYQFISYSPYIDNPYPLVLR